MGANDNDLIWNLKQTIAYQDSVMKKRETLVKTIMNNVKYLSQVSGNNFKELNSTKELLQFT